MISDQLHFFEHLMCFNDARKTNYSQCMADLHRFAIINKAESMSKRELKTYLNGLTKKQLEEQIIDLYSRFKEVKEFYNFAFNPNEAQLYEECRFAISKEYFPVTGRKAKARRSVAQKWIRKLKTLGAEPSLIAGIMLYSIEIAQVWSGDKTVTKDTFYRSMLKSFDETLAFAEQNSLQLELASRIRKIVEVAEKQCWPNAGLFAVKGERYMRT